ncbi:MAG TPA: F0F1 ATP synthase subunit A [Jatrophihabitans sp.]|nr:F0F1 ATP synthase subunit A [Jatrophihabitans sp.]
MSTRDVAINVEVGQHIQWHVFGVTLNGDTIISTLVAGAIVIGLGLALRRSLSARKPGRLQLFWETVVDQVERQVDETIGVQTAPFVVPLALTLFLFLLIANWLSILPVVHHKGGGEWLPPPASDVNLTYALALLVVVLMHVTGVRKKGFRGYYHHLVTPSWALLPINIIEEIVRPVTLALRLFGNIFSGTIMVSLIALFPAYILWAPDVIWKLFDMFIGLIQAFIFALLTILYFSSVRPTEEGAH